jgi:hypothetical protein
MSHMKIPVANVGGAHKLRLPSEKRLGFRLFRSLFSPCIGRLDLGSGPTQRADHVQSYRTILCGFAFRAGKVEVNLPLLRIVTGTGGRRERDEFTGCLARGGDDASEVGRRTERKRDTQDHEDASRQEKP